MSEREIAVVEQANQLVRQLGCLVDFFAGERKALLGFINEFGDPRLLAAAEQHLQALPDRLEAALDRANPAECAESCSSVH